jgi:hypothetical protein
VLITATSSSVTARFNAFLIASNVPVGGRKGNGKGKAGAEGIPRWNLQAILINSRTVIC